MQALAPPASFKQKMHVMRDFRDAKAMAHTLRAAVAAKDHRITNSESLELIARAFGVVDWNTLSAAVGGEVTGPRSLNRSRADSVPGRRKRYRFFRCAFIGATPCPGIREPAKPPVRDAGASPARPDR
jgi:Glyoxalase superfamily protein